MKSQIENLVEQLLEGNIFLPEAIEMVEKRMIAGALERNGGNQSHAAKQLGIHRNTLQRKIADYELTNGRRAVRRKPVGRTSGRSRKLKTA
jgi:Fis family transcriptional regulator